MRYRYDAQRKKRSKTVEFIVVEREWDPPAPRFTAGAIVGMHAGFAVVETWDQAKQASGQWYRSRQVWDLRYAQVVALNLEPRIVEETSHCRYLGLIPT